MSLQFKLKWEKSVSGDLTSQELHYSVDGGSPEVVPLGVEATELDVEFEDNEEVEWFVRSFDDAGNQSDSESLIFVATDKIPPAPATGLAVVPTGETNN